MMHGPTNIKNRNKSLPLDIIVLPVLPRCTELNDYSHLCKRIQPRFPYPNNVRVCGAAVCNGAILLKAPNRLCYLAESGYKNLRVVRSCMFLMK